jgi:type I restriction enzyme, S subunit
VEREGSIVGELPKGWANTNLKELATLINGDRGRNYPSKSSFVEIGIPFINAGHLVDGRIDFSNMNYITEEHFARLGIGKVRPNDILYCLRGSLGKTAIVTDNVSQGSIASSLVILRVLKNYNCQFLYYFLISPFGKNEIDKHDNGSAQPNLSAANVGLYQIPLLNEQKRIAQRLDLLLTRIDKTKAHLDRIPPLLKRFRQSVLAAATSGNLTEDWREANGITKANWKQLVFNEACKQITVGFVGKMADQYCDQGIPFLRSLNVRPFYFDEKNLLFVSAKFHQQIIKSRLEPGDVAVVRSGAPGQCCVIPQQIKEANCSDLVIVRPKKDILLSEYACIFINSSQSQDFVRSEIVGVAQSHFNVGSMKITPLDLPPLPEQAEIVRRVEALFAKADRIEAQYQKARQHLDRLTPALLAKAFRGELVPQDPNDEPASVLLERIKAEKEGREKKEKRKKK